MHLRKSFIIIEDYLCFFYKISNSFFKCSIITSSFSQIPSEAAANKYINFNTEAFFEDALLNDVLEF